ncbi:hypothetical protein BD408DRAFT_446767, partial [Parasitella parasitica]
MKELAVPKAINIIRPSDQSGIKRNHPQLNSKSFKVSTPSQINERPSTFSLYDPKQNMTPSATAVPHFQPLKKPVIELYKPGKHQLKMLNRSESSEQMPNSLLHEPRVQKELTVLSNQEEIDENHDINSGSDNNNNHIEGKEERRVLDNSFPEARINRKIADLEISNKSLLTINEMLEKTAHHQAKQVASFKKQMMTCPEAEKQEQQQQVDIIEQAENEDDWENDEQFNRLKRMTEILIEQAQNALSFQAQAVGGRVIMTGHHHRRSSSTRRHRIIHSSNNSQQQ